MARTKKTSKKGRKTVVRRSRVARKPKVLEPVDFEDAKAVLAEFCRVEKEDPEDWKIEEAEGLGSFGVATVYRVKCGQREYTIVESEDVLRELALAVVKQDLDQEPEIFNQSFLEGHIDKEKLRNALHGDVYDMVYDDLKEAAEKDPLEFWDVHGGDVPVPERAVVEKYVASTFNTTEAEESTPEGQAELADEVDRICDLDVSDQWAEISDEPEVPSGMIDTAADLETSERLSDPVEYMKGIYGDAEGIKQALNVAGIDIDKAAEEAVDTDGPEHFICRYDGNSHTTSPSSFAYWREN